MAMLQVDIYEQVLIRLDVEDLIRCKSVCKSWHSLIFSNRFVKNHLKHSYNSDCISTQIGQRRVIITHSPASRLEFEFDPCNNISFSFSHRYRLLGSSNGLVCISIHNAQLFVVNPSTREVTKLRNHKFGNKPRQDCEGKSVLCFGFGFDSSIDDYKVVVGFMKSNYVTCFHVLTLKSNAWTLVGDVNYCYLRSVVLCNGALHWVMKDPNENQVILSFDLSREKFKQIPQPDDDIVYQSCIRASGSIISLGIIDECLCIFDHESLFLQPIWKMNHYNVKQSWTRVTSHWLMKNDFVHCLVLKHENVLCDKSLSHDIQLCKTLDIIGAPIYVQSLVSPHIQNHVKQKRKQQPTNSSKKTVKILKGDITVHGPTPEVLSC